MAGEHRGPIRRMLERTVDEDALRFCMPGHKGLTDLAGAAYDVTEVPGTDCLFDPTDGILAAMRDSAFCWNAARSFLLVNGSTAGIQAMILWAKTQGRSLLLPRDSHVSAIYACAAAGIQPVWIEPEWNAGEQLTQWGSADSLPIAQSGKSALFVTYPDYYGRCINLQKVKKQIGAHDCALLVDSAHGAHFTFSENLPQDAGCYAAMWVSGAHKTLPAPTQTAFLHVKNQLDCEQIARLLRGVTTTSPSYLLMSGLDNSRVFMQSSREKLEELIGNCLDLANQLNEIDGLRCWRASDVTGMGYGDFDPTRLVVDVRGLGMTGWVAGAHLRELGVQVEMCDIYRVVLIATVMDDKARLDKLLSIFQKLPAYRKVSITSRGLSSLPSRGKTVMTLRQAWLSDIAEVPLAESIGRVAVEPFGAYPPGIPLCMPGEEITGDIIDSVLEAQALGGGFFGIGQVKVLVVK